MIEDRLKETLDRVAGGGPDEAGAFDRFLRHRRVRPVPPAGRRHRLWSSPWRSSRRWPLPRLLAGSGHDAAVRPPARPAPEAHWMARPRWSPRRRSRGSRSRSRPAGRSTATWKGFELRPISPDLRRHLPSRSRVTGVLESSTTRPPNAGGRQLFEDSHTSSAEGRSARRPEGVPRSAPAASRGTTRWFRTDLQHRALADDLSGTSPGRTAASRGVPCPALLALRTLKVVYQVDADAAPRSTAWPGALLRTARPIANAVKGQAHAPRPDCVDGRSMVLRRETDDSLGSGSTARWPISGGGRGPRPTWCPAPSGGRWGSSSWTGPAAGSTCRATAAP